MEQNIFNFWSLLLQIITAIAAAIFAIWQIKINDRLRKLQDFVAVSLVPGIGATLHVMNVGKINLYLHKYEIGKNTENFGKALLIPSGSMPYIQIPIKNYNPNEKFDVKLYLTDQHGEKYISEGSAMVENINISQQNISQGDFTVAGSLSRIIPQVSTYSYQMKKINWEL